MKDFWKRSYHLAYAEYSKAEDYKTYYKYIVIANYCLKRYKAKS